MKYLLIGIVILLGIYLRFVNLSPFKIYPDSYLQLILSENIRHGSIIGTLGKDGMIYPDFLAWTRPMFPLLISFFHRFFVNTTLIAQSISFIASLLALPLAYFLYKKIFNSSTTGILAALLLSVSFNHIVWSGFILTEPLGVFFMLLLLFFVFIAKTRQSIYLDLGVGAVFAGCVLSRYEYILVLFPLLWYLHVNHVSIKRILRMFGSSVIILGITFILLFPLPLLPQMVVQFLPHIQSLMVFIIILSVVGLLWPHLKRFPIRYSRQKILLIVWCLFCIFLLGQTFLFGSTVTGITDFIRSDILLSLCFMGGVGWMLSKKVYTKELTFLLLSCVLLYAAYYRANPYSQRYLVHLLPFFLVPASFFLTKLFMMLRVKRLPQLVLGILTCCIFVYQLTLSYRGMKNWQEGLYTKTSYEEKAGDTLKTMLPNDSLVLVSFPESYYVTTHHSIYSVSDQPPFIYIPTPLTNRKIVIVEDIGMRDIFPTLTKFLESSLKEQKTKSFFTYASYQYADRVLKEKYPVILYQTTVSDLMKKVRQKYPSAQTF